MRAEDGEGAQAAAMANAEFENDFDGRRPDFRFDPSGWVILELYLRKKIAGQLPPCDIPTVDVFASTAPPPWQIHPAASPIAVPSSYLCNSSAVPDKVNDWFYFFTRITPRGSGFCRTTETGTWVASGRDVEIKKGGEILGHQTALAFRTPGGPGTKGANTGWVMHEFKLHRDRKAVKEEVLVVCRIRCIKRGGRDEAAAVEPVPKRHRTNCSEEAPGSSVGFNGGRAGAQPMHYCSATEKAAVQETDALGPATSCHSQVDLPLQPAEEDFWASLDVDLASLFRAPQVGYGAQQLALNGNDYWSLSASTPGLSPSCGLRSLEQGVPTAGTAATSSGWPEFTLP